MKNNYLRAEDLYGYGVVPSQVDKIRNVSETGRNRIDQVLSVLYTTGLEDLKQQPSSERQKVEIM